jgi:segregation and condensation protein A
LQGCGDFVQFETMFDPALGVPGVVVHFLAMLELAREKLVEFTQSEAFAPIYVRVHQGGSEPGQESA